MLPFVYAGMKAGRVTRGLRFNEPEVLSVANAAAYLATLEREIAAARQRGGIAAERARKAQLALLRLQPEHGSLDELRRQMVADILALRQAP